jgi:hypothetical protein
VSAWAFILVPSLPPLFSLSFSLLHLSLPIPFIFAYHNHLATVTTERNSISGRFEYFTPELGTVGLLARSASKGWICVNSDIYTKIMSAPDRVDSFAVEDAGSLMIKNKFTSIYQVLFTLKVTNKKNRNLKIKLKKEEINNLTINSDDPKGTAR